MKASPKALSAAAAARAKVRSLEYLAEAPKPWGASELSMAVVAVIVECRDVDEAIDRIASTVDPTLAAEFVERIEPALLKLFTKLHARLPVTAKRAEENRSRLRVVDGGKDGSR